jgi:hypothetical protein
MIRINPINTPFSSPIVNVEVIMSDYNLQQSEPTISINAYNEEGVLYKTISQPVPYAVHQQWGADNNFMINWVLTQNNIQPINL